MASKDPFNIANSPAVAPIPCTECGNTMHCVRRQACDTGDHQLFICAACGKSAERFVGLQDSDDAVQRAAERESGIQSP
jgi:ferredoxin